MPPCIDSPPLPALLAQRYLTVAHPLGLHLRPANAIVKLVTRSHSNVRIRYGNHEADARSIIDILSLGVPPGTEVIVLADGPDAEAVIESLSKLFADGFGW